MSCLLPFLAVVYICLAFSSRSDRNGPKIKTGSVLKLGRHNMREMNLIDDLPYQEELVIDGEAVNYSLGMMILQYFQETYEQKLFMNIIRAYKTELLTPDEVKRKCRVFLSSFTRAHCQNLAEMYYSPNKPCFLEEQKDRRGLKERGVAVVNKGEQASDLLHILNRIRAGRMGGLEEMNYYVRRYKLYLRIYKSRTGLKVLLQSANISISNEWRVLNTNDGLEQLY